MAKQAKQVQIIERHDKGHGYVYYTVLSSNGKDTYATTLRDGHATACTCPRSYASCYHKTELEIEEKKFIDATLPKLNTAEAKELISEMGDVFKPVLPEGYTVRLVKGVLKAVPQKRAKPAQISAKSVPQKTIAPCVALNKPVQFVNKVA